MGREKEEYPCLPQVEMSQDGARERPARGMGV